MLRALETRRGRDPKQFFDLPFGTFQADPLAAVQSIYAHFGIEYTEAADANIRRFRANNPLGKHGAHAYDLDTWRLDPDEIRERFQPYVETFAVPTEPT